MGKRIVIALGGNALGKNLPEQMLAVKETCGEQPSIKSFFSPR